VRLAAGTAAAPPPLARRLPRVVSYDALGVAAGVVCVLLASAHAAHVGDVPAFETFVLVLVSIVVEALPFVLLGALVAAALGTFVPERVFAWLGRLPLPLQVPAVTLASCALPVCECGSVPVARRLIQRGVHPAAGVGFMLAAPILNPLVLLSTWLAYGGRAHGAEMVAARAGLGIVTAIVVGFAVGGAGRVRVDAATEHEHEPALSTFAGHAVRDFAFMGRFVVIGAVLAAVMQTFAPTSLLTGAASTVIVSELALMAIAFVLSLCSEADAFVAAALLPFPLPAQLSFLVFGPMLDAKLAVLYGVTFRRSFVPRLLAAAVPTILVGSLLIGTVLR
jgi:uncharacterized membrane protein YraQ (UPF0718 family)